MKNNTKKQDILKAYAAVIEKQGLEGASLGAVARFMGINQSLIFHYFENKDDLTFQLSQHVCSLCIKSYEKSMPDDSDFSKESFEYFVEYILEIHHNRRKSVSPKLYYALTYLLPRQKKIKDSFSDLTTKLVDYISQKLMAFNDAGVVNITDFDMAARTLLCLADGILCYDELTPKEKHDAFIATQKKVFTDYVNYKQ